MDWIMPHLPTCDGLASSLWVQNVRTNHWTIERNWKGWSARYRAWLAETMIEVKAECRRRVVNRCLVCGEVDAEVEVRCQMR
jgi:hypothetical protein